MPPRAAPELRETSGATTRLLVGYVRARAGDAGVAEVLRRSGVQRTAAELEDETTWSSYDERIRLFAAAVEVVGDAQAMFKVGASAIAQNLNPSLILLFQALGSPRQVFRNLPRAVPKFSSTSTMEILESSATHAIIRYRLHDGYEHSRLDCAYAQGLFSAVPYIFDLPPARIVHDECQSDGHPACVYHVTWPRYSRWRRRRRAGRTDEPAELIALRGQLQSLQSAAADITSSDDVDTVLARITERASAAVLAQGFVLAVDGVGGQPVVRFHGVDPVRAEAIAGALRRGEDPGASAVVVEVASSRRHHGHLAAIYSDGQRGMADEGSLLRAYAGHAAASLDLLLALEKSRRGYRAARNLLGLAHDLARARTPDDVARVATAAMPGIAGVDQGFVVLADVASRPAVEALAAELDGRPAAPVALAALAAATGAITAPEPAAAAVAPLLADGELLGLVAGTWSASAPPVSEDAALAALAGVADQTSTALQNAYLVTRIRHQSLHDALTGLPNRRHFGERLEAAIAGARDGDGLVAVLFCDLDAFKDVNDSLGHAAGDELLRQVAERLRGSVRAEDVVARLSGDEFAILLPAVPDRAAAERVGRSVTAAFAAPFRVMDRELRCTTSVGVAVERGADASPDALLHAADAAMYAAKEGGDGRVATAARAAG
ncbi:MAG TPA: diguanylate cyclase [Baekduia sp.]|nr:diguanylate cyclase [Baekduia sp.]